KLRLEGIDPIHAREERKEAARQRSLTFREAALEYIEDHDAGWRSAKHRREWVDTLRVYAYPVLGDLPVQLINVDLLLKALKPIWETKTETASRVRGRIEMVLDFAKARGLRSGDNPADWDVLKHLLPKPNKVRRKAHFEALPFEEINQFMTALRGQSGVAARALEFLILTATRFGETRGARWDEIQGDVWVIPAERTKAHKEHRIPLCGRALEILSSLPRICELVFPGRSLDRPLGQNALL